MKLQLASYAIEVTYIWNSNSRVNEVSEHGINKAGGREAGREKTRRQGKASKAQEVSIK